MGHFTFEDSERESQLELALQGVPFSKNIVCKFNGMGENKDQAEETAVYMLPVDTHNNKVYGFLTIDDKLSKVPIGFSRKKDFSSKEYFRPNKKGSLVKKDFRNSILYLPLRLTNYASRIGVMKSGKFVYHEGSPFQIYGVEGKEGIHPIMLTIETEEGIKFKGVYKTKDSGISMYGYNLNRPSGDEMREFLKQLRGIKPVQVAVVGELAKKTSQPKKDHEKPRVTIESSEKVDWEDPKTITRYLDQYVVGQEDAKVVVAVSVSNYMTKVRTGYEELKKDNLLLIGPSGSGKTYMLSLLAKEASLPMVETKLTGKSSEGYKGENLSRMFEQIRATTNEEAPYGIVFLDEIDKLARGGFGTRGFGSELQDELIGWLEEATIVLGSDTRGKKKGTDNRLNTRNILFVAAGAFQGLGREDSLSDIISKRLGHGKRQIGFETSEKKSEEEQDSRSVLHKSRPEDLIAYGLKTELIGRLPSIGILDPLSIDDKVKILTEAHGSPLEKYQLLLQLKGYKVELGEDVSEVIAGYCPQETGARALNSICNNLFTRILYEPKKYADDKGLIKVTPDLARELINLYE